MTIHMCTAACANGCVMAGGGLRRGPYAYYPGWDEDALWEELERLRKEIADLKATKK